jgi:hypothetical protein
VCGRWRDDIAAVGAYVDSLHNGLPASDTSAGVLEKPMRAASSGLGDGMIRQGAETPQDALQAAGAAVGLVHVDNE